MATGALCSSVLGSRCNSLQMHTRQCRHVHAAAGSASSDWRASSCTPPELMHDFACSCSCRVAQCQPSRRQMQQPVRALFGGGNKEVHARHPLWHQSACSNAQRRAVTASLSPRSGVILVARGKPSCAQGGGGGNPFANMGNLMENMKKAQELVQVGASVTCAGS